MSAYHRAQSALAELKAAIYETLTSCSAEGLSNAQIGRMLGIYSGHVGHEGHIPRTLLAIMEQESVVEQDKKTKRWRIRNHHEVDSGEHADPQEQVARPDSH